MNTPQPYGPTPSKRQLQWHALEAYAFIHFSINTFTDKEWGYGDESPALFNPSAFDADQIAGVTQQAGLRGLVLTCKHHDGFCLWPSRYTEHSVKNSPWKNGQGDVVRELSDACRRHALKFGVYLSPWDRNHADYGKPEYLQYYRSQLRELLTDYGPIFEVWFDGANGGDGYYCGAYETRSIDNRTYYDWENTWSIVRALQPEACMFSDGGPDIRWVGNESGYAGDPCWSTINAAGLLPGHAEPQHLHRGDRPGTHWLPAEVDVSIRPGWFYHERENSAVRTVSNLLKIYFASVGRGTNLIFNLPPDRRGLIHEKDAAVLREWNRILTAAFADNLAQRATITAGSTRVDTQSSVSHLCGAQNDTYWMPQDDVKIPELILEWDMPVTFNVLQLSEYLSLGQRVDAFVVDVWKEGRWEELCHAEGIGNRRLLRTPDTTTSRVRLRITQATACPAISGFGLFMMPLTVEEPRITRSREGIVTITAERPDALIRYTLDEMEPMETSTLFTQPFPFLRGGTVKARIFLPEDIQQSETTTVNFTQSKAQWQIVRASSARQDAPAQHAIDGDPETLWISEFSPTTDAAPPELVIDMGETLPLTGFTLLPRQDAVADGTPDRYAFYVSDDAQIWKAPVATGEFSNIKSNRILQSVLFDTPATGRYFQFVILSTIDKMGFAAIAEIGVLSEEA